MWKSLPTLRHPHHLMLNNYNPTKQLWTQIDLTTSKQRFSTKLKDYKDLNLNVLKKETIQVLCSTSSNEWVFFTLGISFAVANMALRLVNSNHNNNERLQNIKGLQAAEGVA